MWVPRDPDQLWKRDQEDVEEREIPRWAEILASLGLAIALFGLVLALIGIVFLYAEWQPYANITIVLAIVSGFVGMFLGFGEGIIHQTEDFRRSE